MGPGRRGLAIHCQDFLVFKIGEALESLKDRRGLQFMGLLWLLSVILGVYRQGTGYCHDPR